MREQRVIAIDPAPGKLTTVFDGAAYEGLSASELRDRIDQISSLGSETLLCWDAPLTGPADPASAGMNPFDFTKRAIERFFTRQETGFKAPKGITVLGYGACPHWTISRSILGLPRVGPFDQPESKLPFHLLTGLDKKGDSRPSIVEIHPALAAWLWCRSERKSDASWIYKGNSPESKRIRAEMWEIILHRSGFDEDLSRPKTDDEFDAAVGYILGSVCQLSETRQINADAKKGPQNSFILGNSQDGCFLVPHDPELAAAWAHWNEVRQDKSDKNTLSDHKQKQRRAASNSMVRLRRGRIVGASKVKQLASAVSTTVMDTTSAAVEITKGAAKQTSDATRDAFSRASVGSRRMFASAVDLADELLATTQGLLASSLSIDINNLLQATVKGSATIYDKAMDAEYIRTHIGGGNHRMFDGGHTIIGAIREVRDASPGDTGVEEAMGFLEAMFKDLTTPKGLPLANWDKGTYDQVAGYLKSNFNIPKDWFYDINSYDAAEVLGGAIGFAAVALGWNRADTEQFSSLVGGMGLSAILGANPFLLLLTVIALARAFHKAHHGGEYVKMADGLLKGGIGSGAALVATSQVAVVGGPAGLALLAGLSAGVIVNRAGRNLSVDQFRQFVTERTTATAVEIKNLADSTAEPPEPPPQPTLA